MLNHNYQIMIPGLDKYLFLNVIRNLTWYGNDGSQQERVIYKSVSGFNSISNNDTLLEIDDILILHLW